MVSALCDLVRWELTSPTQRRLGSVPHHLSRHLNRLAHHFHPILCSLDSLPRCLDSPPCRLDPLLCRLRLRLRLRPPPLRLLPPSSPPAMSLHRPARSQTSSAVMVRTRSPVRRLPIASSSIRVMRSSSTQRLAALQVLLSPTSSISTPTPSIIPASTSSIRSETDTAGVMKSFARCCRAHRVSLSCARSFAQHVSLLFRIFPLC